MMTYIPPTYYIHINMSSVYEQCQYCHGRFLIFLLFVEVFRFSAGLESSAFAFHAFWPSISISFIHNSYPQFI